MAKHALLSASSASRWMKCTPSARLTEKMADTSSPYAQEGTLAHELGELELKRELKLIDKKTYAAELKKIKAHELYGEDMPDYVGIYTGYAMEKLAEAKARSKDALVFLEQRLDFSDWVPEGFGTGDTVIISDGVIEIIDLKFGKGVPVSAEWNPQMMLYGLGAWNEYDFLYDLHTVRMTIAQPRLDNLSTFELSSKELVQWAENKLKPTAAMAWDGMGDLCAGKHCQFCKVEASCQARAKAKEDFINDYRNVDGELLAEHLLAPDDVSRIVGMALEIKNWLKAVEDFALDKALEGFKWPGYKLVEGRSNRTYSDEAMVATILTGKGLTEDDIYNKKIKGITEMEKKLGGKKKFEEVLGSHIIKPAGKPTLVEESDKRPELDSVAEDFNLE